MSQSTSDMLVMLVDVTETTRTDYYKARGNKEKIQHQPVSAPNMFVIQDDDISEHDMLVRGVSNSLLYMTHGGKFYKGHMARGDQAGYTDKYTLREIEVKLTAVFDRKAMNEEKKSA